MRRLLVLVLLPLLARTAPAGAAPGDSTPAGRCVIEPAPVVRAARAPAPPCHQPPRAVAATVRAVIASKYLPRRERGKAQVTFGCDGLGPSIREIVVETGGGHVGTLSLWRARRATGTRYDARGILYAGASMISAAKAPPFELAAGRVELPDLELVRAALSARVTEVAPPPPPGTIGGLTMSTSSHDFHVLVRLTDDDGRVLERTYTGYAGSSGQDRYLGAQLAADSLDKLTGLAPTGTTVTDDDRRLFAERFAAAVPHFDDDFSWWVMERHVDLARYLGSPPTIAGLLTRLVVKQPDRSKLDARVDALDALARITGWDARPGVSVEQAAALYLAECKPR